APPPVTSSGWPRPRARPFAIDLASCCATKSFFWETSDRPHLVIEGGRRLSGRITVEGNKNAALPILAACLLTPETCEIRNVPGIRDVAVMLDLLRSLGAEVEHVDTTTVRVTCRDVHVSQPDSALVGKLRGEVGRAHVCT